MAKRGKGVAKGAAAVAVVEDEPIEQETPPAADAAETEGVEVELSPDLQSVIDKGLEAVEVEEPEPPAPAPKKPAAVAPKAEAPKPETPRPPAKPLDPVAREERNKRKHYAELAGKALRRVDKLERQVAQLQSGQVPYPKERIQGRIEKLRKLAEDPSAEMGKLFEALMTEVTDEIETRYAERDTARRVSDFQADVARKERAARARYKDYDEVLQQSGIYAATKIVNGQYVDPELAAEIYGADDPCETGYQTGKEILRLRGVEPEEESEEGSEEPAAPARDEVAEAERRGAARVVDKVVRNAGRVRGIDRVPAAPAPKRRFTREALDDLMEKNPAAYAKLIEENPQVGVYHLAGRDDV